jgi:hypothetical protein
MAKITIELSADEHRRFVNAKMDGGFRSLQALMIQATEQWLAGVPGAQAKPAEKPTGSGLTDDQIDTLEMLSADWEEEFGFSQIQYLVTAALEKYRARRKTLRPGKPPRRSKAS